MPQEQLAVQAAEVFRASVELAEKWTMLGYAAQAAMWDSWVRPAQMISEEWRSFGFFPELPILTVL